MSSTWMPRLLVAVFLCAAAGCGSKEDTNQNFPEKGVPPPMPGGMQKKGAVK